MKTIKTIAVAISAIVLLLVAAVVGIAIFFDLNHFKPTLTRRLGDTLQRGVAVNGDLELNWALPPVLSAGNITIANAQWGSGPQMAQVDRMEVTIDWPALFGGELKILRIGLEGVTLVLEQNQAGDWNLPPSGPDESAEAQPGGRPFAVLELTASRVLLRTPRQERTFTIEQARLDFGKPNQPTRLRGRFGHKSALLTLDANLTPSQALFQGAESFDIDLELQAADNRLNVKGSVASPAMPPQLDLQFELDGRNPRGLAALTPLPRGFEEPLTLSGRLHSQNRHGHYRISDFAFESGPNDVAGWFELDPFRETLQIRTDLTARHFDLRAYLPPDSSESGPAAPSSAQEKSGANDRLFSDEPLDWRFLERFEADADLTARVLKLPRLGLENLDARITVKEGRFDLQPLTATIGGGTLEGAIQLTSAEPPRMEASVEVQRLDLGKMLQELNLPASIKGETGLKINLAGQGASPAQMAGSLNGQVSLVMQGGQLASRYLRMSELYGFELTDAFLNLFKPPEKEKFEDVEINCVVCHFQIRDGVADSDVLVFDMVRAGVVGDGYIDLKSERLNIALKSVSGGGIGIPGLGKLKLGAATITDAFKLGGTLRHPAIRVDKSESAFKLGKAIGGMLLFGPVGLTIALLESEFGKNNPCVKALEEVSVMKEQ